MIATALLALSFTFTPPPSIHKIQYEQYKNFKLPDVGNQVPKIPLQPRMKSLYKTVYGFLPYWQLSSYTLIHWDLISHLAAFGIELDGNGNVTNRHGWVSNWAAVIDSAHAHGVHVHLVIIIFNSDNIHSILTNPTARQNAINTIKNEVLNGQVEGANLDLEVPYSSDRNALNNFVTMLHDTLQAHGKELTICVTAVNWNDRFDVATLAANTEGLFIMGYDYFWSGSGTAGPVSPLTGYTYNVTSTVNYYVANSNGHPEKIILGVPYYGYKWPTYSDAPGSATRGRGRAVFYQQAISEAQSYGLLWDDYSQTPWYKYYVTGDGWYQTWFDNDSSLGLKWDLVNNANIQGTGMWALTYDGTRSELWNELARHFAHGTPPGQPSGFMVRLTGPNKIQLEWYPDSGATYYDVYMSTDGENFSYYTTTTGPSFQDRNVPAGEMRFYKVRAGNPFGVSGFTEVLGAVSSTSPNNVLIVNGFDRVGGTHNTFDFIREHGIAMHEIGARFNSTSNERVEDGSVNLTDYQAVDWILGEEGTSTQSFSPAEQTAVEAYLEAGGKLFVSGSEIGYDLWERGDSTDHLFYHNYLKANYLGDDAGTYFAVGTADGIFNGLDTLQFDDGRWHYDVDYPDGVGPYGGSVSSMVYVGGTGWSAGIQYEGTFGNSSTPGKLVYLGFPFESILNHYLRKMVMYRVLSYFGLNVYVAEGSSHLTSGIKLYPNPAGRTLYVSLPANARKVEVYDISGRKIVSKWVRGNSTVSLDLKNLPSGIYHLTVKNRDGSLKTSRFIRR